MHLFARIADIQSLAGPDAPVQALLHQVQQAWYLRQHDPVQSAQAVLAAQAMLANEDLVLPTTARIRTQARLLLVQAESHWLQADFETAQALAHDALALDNTVDDQTVHADANFLLSQVHSNNGNLTQRDACLERAVDAATLGQDSERIDFLEATQARYASLRDTRQALVRWGQRFSKAPQNLPPSVAPAVHNFLGTIKYNTGHFAEALQHLNLSFEGACETGQIVTAVTAAVNAGNTYVGLNDHEAALEWLNKGLDLARAHSWPLTLGPCLRQIGEIMRIMGRLDVAQTQLDEALQVFAPLQNSRNFSMVLAALGDLAMDQGDFGRARALFVEKITRAKAMGQLDQEIEGQLGLARALMGVQNMGEAQFAISRALTLAQGQGATMMVISALRLLAQLHRAWGHREESLKYLEQALSVARTIVGYLLPGELLHELADEYAHVGRFEEAYQTAVAAGQARERVLTQDAANRATAMQVRLDTERSRAESEFHRRHAEAEGRRAELLQQTSDTLALLGTIGQEITSQLDKEGVFACIERHVHGLLDASSFTIYLMDADGQGLTSVYDMEEGRRLPSDHVRLNDARSFSARCVRERTELLIDFSDPGLQVNYVPGTLATLSALFAPLTVANRILGVMTIQSTRAHAYGDNARLVFRTLCAYAAIALDNAVAYAHLRDAKDQLVVQEKLAALGSLVAGVAHELNTPLGNSLLTATSLRDQTQQLELAIVSGNLRRSTLTDYLSISREGLDLVIRGLEAAGELVQSFKQVAVDRATEQRRPYDLLRTSQEVVATLSRSIQRAGHRIEIDIPPDLVIDGYPGPYGQVLTNFINNAMLHGFEGRSGGFMLLRARLLNADQVEVVFSDDGSGISAPNLKRVFDPFFTTKMGQGGSGLGLSISYNIVTGLFGGELLVDSTPGLGTNIIIRMPVHAPRQAGQSHFAETLRAGL